MSTHPHIDDLGMERHTSWLALTAYACALSAATAIYCEAAFYRAPQSSVLLLVKEQAPSSERLAEEYRQWHATGFVVDWESPARGAVRYVVTAEHVHKSIGDTLHGWSDYAQQWIAAQYVASGEYDVALYEVRGNPRVRAARIDCDANGSMQDGNALTTEGYPYLLGRRRVQGQAVGSDPVLIEGHPAYLAWLPAIPGQSGSPVWRRGWFSGGYVVGMVSSYLREAPGYAILTRAEEICALLRSVR